MKIKQFENVEFQMIYFQVLVSENKFVKCQQTKLEIRVGEENDDILKVKNIRTFNHEDWIVNK